MSLMGYTEEDVLEMMAGINIALDYMHDFKTETAISKALSKTYDFLDGLLVEGRV